MAELKACPFCGSYEKEGCYLNGKIAVQCLKCGVIVAEEQWQFRPLESALQSELDTLKQSVKDADGELFTDWECLHDSPLLADNLKAEGIKLARTCLRSHGLIGKE